MDDIYNTALNDFSYHLARTEIQVFKDRQRWIAQSKLTAWFQSSSEKAVFGRLLYVGTVVKQGYTLTQISSELQISRQTISAYLKETVAAGWVVPKQKGKTLYYYASDELCKSLVDYANYSSDLFQMTEVHEAEHLLGLLKKRQNDLPVNVLKRDYYSLRGEKDDPQKKAS
jgi:hypothetical protein